MITAWRAAFNDAEMPLGVLSLCTDGYPQTRDNYVENMFDAGIYIRAAQYKTFLKFHNSGDANVGYASTYDLRRRWYHPQLKLPAGERIARWALATQYGFEREVSWQPPILLGMKAEAGVITLELDTEVGDPEDGAIEGFAIAGEDRKFHPATADFLVTGKDDRGRDKKDNKIIVLTSLMVKEPVHYRYAWSRNPMGNLQNQGIPLATQRSDEWPKEEIYVDGELKVLEGRQIGNELRKLDQERALKEADAILETRKDK
jgi:sialate O-acetylesterase